MSSQNIRSKIRSIITKTVSATTTPVLLLAEDEQREYLEIQNQGQGTITFKFGSAPADSVDGYKVAGLASWWPPTDKDITAAIYVRGLAATQSVKVFYGK